MFRFLAVTAFTLAMACSAGAQTMATPVKWQNQRGSELTITSIDATGALKGTFVNKAEGFECQNTPFDVTGRLFRSSEIFFVVTFGPCNTVTRWRGNIRGSKMRTYWLLTYVRPKDGGFTRLSGVDRFEKK